MATITYDSAGPGQAAKRPALVQSSAVMIFVTGKVAFDSSYPTGGEDISDVANQFPRQLLGVVWEGSGGYQFETDYTANAEKVKAFYGDNNNAADGPLIEVPNATNLSALTGVRFLAWGW